MPPALAPVSPAEFKQFLELASWTLHSQDEFHWIMEHPDHNEPCLIPKDTDLVSIELMMSIFRRTGWALGDYFEAKESIDNGSALIN